MLSQFVAVVLGALPWMAPLSYADNYDGDTVTLTAPVKVTVRLQNVDTPEIRGACERERALARAARDAVSDILAGASRIELSNVQWEPDRYGRTLANVRADGIDVGQELVRLNLARPWTGRREPWC